jgi:hypothetical protein
MSEIIANELCHRKARTITRRAPLHSGTSAAKVLAFQEFDMLREELISAAHNCPYHQQIKVSVSCASIYLSVEAK